MTETTHPDPTPEGDTHWLIGGEPASDVVTSAPGRRTAFVAVGLVAAGALVGGVAVAALRPHSSTNASIATNPTGFATGQVPSGQVPNGQGLPGQGLPGQNQGGFAGGGVTGEQRLNGTVTAVGASSVTIRTTSGTTAYGVTSQTEIVRNGALASLSAVRKGDSAFVHLIPGSGSSYVVERLFAQSGRALSNFPANVQVSLGLG
jgi:hypothetical protein